MFGWWRRKEDEGLDGRDRRMTNVQMVEKGDDECMHVEDGEMINVWKMKIEK